LSGAEQFCSVVTAEAAAALWIRSNTVGGVSKKLEIIRAAAQHNYPVTNIDDMLAEIERGYGTGAHP